MPAAIDALLEQALGGASAALERGLATLDGVVATLPPAAREVVGGVLAMVRDDLGDLVALLPQVSAVATQSVRGVLDSVAAMLTGLTGAPAGGGDAATAIPSLAGRIAELVPGLDRLLGGLLPRG